MMHKKVMREKDTDASDIYLSVTRNTYWTIAKR